MLPTEMMTVAIEAFGGPEVLVPQRRPVPLPGEGEVLIEVAAAGVNRPDVLQRKGLYPAPPGASDLPGLEVSGKVVALGAGATRFKLGDEVVALVPGGGYAEFCTAHESSTLRAPSAVSLVDAAAIPETFFTVWHNVFERGHLIAGETLLVHGGGSGIGTTAIQLAKAFGARVIVTAGSDRKCEACRDLGADLAINYTREDFVAAAMAATDDKGVNLILDMVGGKYIERNLDVAAPDGRIVQIGFQEASRANVDFTPVMLKRLVFTGSTLRSRPVAVKAGIARQLEEKVWPLLSSGQIKPQVFRSFPLAEAAAAHALMEQSGHIGKLVLVA